MTPQGVEKAASHVTEAASCATPNENSGDDLGRYANLDKADVVRLLLIRDRQAADRMRHARARRAAGGS